MGSGKVGKEEIDGINCEKKVFPTWRKYELKGNNRLKTLQVLCTQCVVLFPGRCYSYLSEKTKVLCWNPHSALLRRRLEKWSEIVISSKMTTSSSAGLFSFHFCHFCNKKKQLSIARGFTIGED